MFGLEIAQLYSHSTSMKLVWMSNSPDNLIVRTDKMLGRVVAQLDSLIVHTSKGLS
jgi:hypothetical protein